MSEPRWMRDMQCDPETGLYVPEGCETPPPTHNFPPRLRGDLCGNAQPTTDTPPRRPGFYLRYDTGEDLR